MNLSVVLEKWKQPLLATAMLRWCRLGLGDLLRRLERLEVQVQHSGRNALNARARSPTASPNTEGCE
jgi:hypothetical protein